MKCRTSQLGLTVIAPAAAGGPVTFALVNIAVIAGELALKFLHIGAGRTEADYLTNPGTGAQWLAGQALDEIIHVHYLPAWESGQVTPAFILQTIDALNKVQTDFCQYAAQFHLAGPGACRTITNVVSILVHDRSQELQQLYSELPPMQIFRLILRNADGLYDTGATYPGCDPATGKGSEPWQLCDPQQFDSLTRASIYAEQHGEIPKVVNSVAEALAFNAEQQRQWATTATHTGPSNTPPPPNTSAGVTNQTSGPIYRLLLEGGGVVNSGATYPGCNPRSDQQALCQPRQFASIADAVTYAYTHNEIPVRVYSVDEAYAIAEGSRAIEANQVLAPSSLPAPASSSSISLPMIGAGLAALFLFSRRRPS